MLPATSYQTKSAQKHEPKYSNVHIMTMKPLHVISVIPVSTLQPISVIHNGSYTFNVEL